MMIKFCPCVNKFQDEKYGKQQRLHNECIKDARTTGFRCTVCGNKKIDGGIK